MFNDSVTDFINRINNALRSQKKEVEVRSSNIVFAISQIFKDKGMFSKVNQGDKEINLVFSPTLGPWVNIKAISKPNHRQYRGYQNIPRPKNPKGFIVISTPKGIVTHEQAKKMKVGGELICEVW